MKVTDVLELVGLLLVVVGAALFVGQWTLPGAVVLAGVLLVGLSALIVKRGRR